MWLIIWRKYSFLLLILINLIEYKKVNFPYKYMESKNIVSEIPTIHNKIFDFRFQKKQITVPQQ